jgi:putative transposase
MPWKESSVMEERLCFVARLLDGEPMTEVCRDFGISRKTGYKIFDRYNEHGLQALTDRSCRPAIESEGCMRRRSQNNVGVFNIVGF